MRITKTIVTYVTYLLCSNDVDINQSRIVHHSQTVLLRYILILTIILNNHIPVRFYQML